MGTLARAFSAKQTSQRWGVVDCMELITSQDTAYISIKKLLPQTTEIATDRGKILRRKGLSIIDVETVTKKFDPSQKKCWL